MIHPSRTLGFVAPSSASPLQDGIPDWLQTTDSGLHPAETADAAQRRSRGAPSVNADNPAEGGLDWLTAAAVPSFAGKPAAAAVPAVGVSHQLVTVAGAASGQSVADVAGGTAETDWLAAALRGDAPNSCTAPTGIADAAKPMEGKGARDLFIFGMQLNYPLFQHLSGFHDANHIVFD